ncbi:hypothetical protein D3C81_1720590 [compost metagenome]
MAPMNPPAIAPPITAAYIGFLYFTDIPYTIGSVIPPKSIGNIAEIAKDFVLLFFVLKNTPKAAPACAKLAAATAGRIVSKPYNAILLSIIGTIPQ